MSVLDQLSSQVGDRTEKSNLKVVAQCLIEPALLAEIAEGLTNTDAACVGDCAEVMTKVAEERPELVAPYANALTGLLAHKTNRVRWEAMHALALIADLVPQVMASLLLRLPELVRSDPSVIVRDYAIDAVGNYAQTSEQAAQAAYPILVEALTVWNGKHAAHALDGLSNVATAAPGLAGKVGGIGFRYHDHGRGVVRKAAKRLLKAQGNKKEAKG